MRQSLDIVRRGGAVIATMGAGAFDPRQVPEIAAGYFWDPTAATGSGATLVIPEGNGKSTYNLVTPGASAAPTIGAVNGQAVAQYANGVPDQLTRTNAAVTRGWTGASYFAAWFQAGANVGSIFGHWRTANNLILILSGATSGIIVNDGANEEYRWGVGACDGTARFIEGMFDPSQVATNRCRLFFDLVEQTAPTLNPAVGSTITDTSEFITVGGTVGDGSTFNYTNDFKTGIVYLGNGIPSAADRLRIFGHRALK